MDRSICRILRLAAWAFGAVSLLFGSSAFAQSITLTDIAGRQVTLERPAQHVILGVGRQLNALALLHPDPVGLVAGWLGELQRFDSATYALYREKFPAIDKIPLVGITSAASFSVEKALSVRPDVAIFSGGHGPSERSSEAVRQIEAAGIPVVFVDFHGKPLENTMPSMEILGKVLGREEQARAFAAFYKERLDRIARGIAATREKPKVFLHMHAQLRECCLSAGKGNLGEFIAFAGGENIAAAVLPGPTGQLNLEYVLAAKPDIYIATGGAHTIGKGLAIGTSVDERQARESLAAVIRAPGFASIPAVKNEAAFGLWHHFYNSPLNILALEAMATWFHPEAFKDLDPEKSLAEVNARFLAAPYKGNYWVSLKPRSR